MRSNKKLMCASKYFLFNLTPSSILPTKKKRWEGKEWIYTYRPTTAMSVYTHNHTLACHHCYNQGKPRVKWDE